MTKDSRFVSCRYCVGTVPVNRFPTEIEGDLYESHEQKQPETRAKRIEPVCLHKSIDTIPVIRPSSDGSEPVKSFDPAISVKS